VAYKKVKKIGLVLLISGIYIQLFAQEYKQPVDEITLKYLQVSGSFSTLYYGNEYEGNQRTTNHPFLKDIQFTKARLSYQDVVYPEVLIRLDLFRNELIILSPISREIVLFPEKVDYVDLHGFHVVYFQKDSLPGCPPNGYYLLLHAGKCRVWEKINATILEKSTTNRLDRYFEFSSLYYLYLDGQYYTIKSRKGLWNVLQPYKKELKQFVSSRKLNFRNNTGQFLIETVREYESIR